MDIRRSEWLKGLEFFKVRINQNQEEYKKLQSLYDDIYDELREYLLHFRPINLSESSNYQEVIYLNDSTFVFDGLINQSLDCFMPFYSINEIIELVEEQEDDLFRKLKILPICSSVPGGDIVCSLDQNNNPYKLYSYTDIYEFDFSDEYLFANSLFEFISKIRKIPI